MFPIFRASYWLTGFPSLSRCRRRTKFRLTKEELEAAITPKTKVLILSYPNNPTGAVMSKEDLEAIAEVIIAHDLFVITDENL